MDPAISARAEGLYKQAMELESRGLLSQAQPLRRQLLALMEEKFGPDNSYTDNARKDLADNLGASGEFELSRRLYETCVASRERAKGARSREAAEALSWIADSYRFEGQFTNSEPYYVRARAILESIPGTQQVLAQIIANHGQLKMSQDDLAGARLCFEKTWKLVNESAKPDILLGGWVLNLWGEIQRSHGFLKDAEGAQNEAAGYLKNLPPDSYRWLTAELNRSATLRDLGKTREAVDVSSNCVAQILRTRGPNHSDTLSFQFRHAENLTAHGEHSQALTLLADIRLTLEKAGRNRTSFFARLLNKLGDCQVELLDLKAAGESYELALPISRELLGEYDALTCGIRERMASVALHSGDFSRAQRLIDSLIELRQRTVNAQPERFSELASTLFEKAKLERAIGSYKAADTTLQEVQTIQSKRLPPVSAGVADTLEMRGLIAYDLGKVAAALEFQQQVFKIRQQLYGDKSPHTARTRLNIAAALVNRGELKAAAAELEPARRVLLAELGPKHPFVAVATFNLANVRHKLGEFAEAETLYQQARAAFQETDSRRALTPAVHLALLQLQQDRREPASLLAQSAFAEMDQLWNDVLRLGTERDRLAWTGYADILTLLASLADKDPATLATAVLRKKGAVLDSLIEDRMLAARATGSTSNAFQELQKARAELNRSVALSRNRAGAFPTKQRTVQQLEARLASELAPLNWARTSSSVTERAVSERLSPDTVLVEYVRFSRWTRNRPGTTEPGFGALIYCKNRPVKWVELAPVEGKQGIAEPLGRMHAMLRTRDMPLPSALVRELEALRELVWDPVVLHFPIQTKWVIVAPDGELNLIPFAALWRKDHFLGEEFFFRYLASARDITQDPQPLKPSKSIDIWANPQLSRPLTQRVKEALKNRFLIRAGDDSGKLDSLQFIQIPYADTEGKEIKELALAAGFNPVKLFQNTNATKSVFSSRSAPYILHFATHGYFDSGGVIQRETQMRVDPISEPTFNPMRAAWIVLAGANETLEEWRRGNTVDPRDDGLLTAEDIAALDLSNTWLVTLSACDTGLGTLKAGEGVFGLRRAFAMAGVRNLVVTLWPVSDVKGPEFMKPFYSSAFRSGNASEAMALTQRALLEYWRKDKGIPQAVIWAGCYILNSRGL